MTPGVVCAVEEAKRIAEAELLELELSGEPSLADPSVGKPISHGQLIALSKLLRKHADKIAETDSEGGSIVYSLDLLLKGCAFYVPPPPPKKEPVRITFGPCIRLISDYCRRPSIKLLWPV